MDHETSNSKCILQTSKCQGKGIFIFSKISDINKWKGKENGVENYVCQKYILNPLLFGGRKFDMRIYALCTSYSPLTIYLYRSGFARFAHDHYDNTDIENLCTKFDKVDKHLTNVAINMSAPTYVKRIGGKWFLDNLKNFMLSKYK
jgi:tubulin polyglutamylase TTLL9